MYIHIHKYIYTYVELLLCHCDEIPDINILREGRLILFMVSEDSVHGFLAPCFRQCIMVAEAYNSKASLWKTERGGERERKRKRKRKGDRKDTPRTHPQ
jgi:hypothetical protein